jgi:hypothetical protein
MLAACAPPNTCDQSLIDDLAAIGWLSSASTPDSQTGHTVAPITCDGGGSASMDVTGYTGQWSATFTFDTCTIAVGNDVLTLIGTMSYFNGINDNDAGTSSSLTITGTVDGCATAIDETCELSWRSEPKEPGTNYNYYRTGTVCGRRFP